MCTQVANVGSRLWFQGYASYGGVDCDDDLIIKTSRISKIQVDLDILSHLFWSIYQTIT